MKTALRALFTLLLSAALFAETPEFRLEEPISLDLKDAKVTEVITLLGALAHLPVSIDPSIQGSITIRLENVPYEAVLRKVSEPLGFTLKIEGGKLVAAPRSGASRESRAAAAVPLPDAPRIAVKDYRGAFKDLAPLFVRWRSEGTERCARLTFTSGTTFDADGTSVTSFGWEPVTRTRLIAVDGPEGLRAIALGDPPSLPGEMRFPNGLAILPHPPANAPCAEGAGSASRGRGETVFLRVDELREDGSRLALAAPRLQVRPGTPFSFRSRVEDTAGLTREVVVSGYLSQDGRSVVAVLAATALRSDADGKEYVYVQSTARDSGDTAVSSNPLPTIVLSGDEALAASLGKGSALSRPVELRLFRPEN
ncbi:MAG: hypothetical protein M3167_17530 [Acidobacteriota bacterium]|nr:hypothetical protein [Acidobacteriota bacterium]